MENKGINVLSLFDGMSCGQIALERINIPLNNYYASEIDKYAQIVSKANYPNTIYIGDVRFVDVSKLEKIDLLIGGSPCQSFSFAGKRVGMSTKDSIEILTLEYYLELKEQNFEFEGQSYLFWEYIRILNDIKKYNPNVRFLLENVSMSAKWQKVLTQAIGINPIFLNSSLLSAQNRERLYWTNINSSASGFFDDFACKIEQPKDKEIIIKDILQDNVDEKYYLSKKLIAGFEKHKERHDNKGSGFGFIPKDGTKKANTFRANAALCPTDNVIIIHNTQRRNADRPSLLKNKNAGGSGHLSRADGKTYCLDTQQVNAVEIRKIKQISNYNRSNNGNQPFQQDRIRYNGISIASQAQLTTGSSFINTTRIRKLTPIECERLQTVPDNYTNYVSDSQRYKMIGNGWTVDVVAYILNYLKKELNGK